MRYFSMGFSVGIGCRKSETRSSAADMSVTGSMRSFHRSWQSRPTTSDSFSPAGFHHGLFKPMETRSPSQR
jgi:hypothetical protein